MGLAEVLAECGGLAARLAELHGDDGTGHCQGCKWWDRPLPVHPCATRVVADRALEVLAAYEGLPGWLIDVHADDGTGHCAGCASWERPRPAHPCPTRSAAVRALRLQVSLMAGQPLAKGTTGPLA